MPEALRMSFRLPFAEAIRSARARKPIMPDAYYSDAQDDARRTAWTVSGLAGLSQIREVLDSLNDAQARGVSFGEWRRGAAEATGLPQHRLELIFRMHAQTAYNAGHWRRFEVNADTRPFLMYSAVNDDRTRPAHRALSGYIAHKDDPVWETLTPPLGFNCFLPGTIVSGEFLLGLKSWYAGPTIEIVTQGSRRLSVTSNHPILTARGWIRACELDKTDDLICDQNWPQEAATGAAVNDQQSPSAVEERFDALARDAFGFVKAAAFDFHNDMRFRKGDVNVAGAYSILVDGFQAAPNQFRKDRNFVRTPDRVAGYTSGFSQSRAIAASQMLTQQALDVAFRGTQRACDRGRTFLRRIVLREHLRFQRVVLCSPSIPSFAKLAFNQFRRLFDSRPLHPFGIGLSAKWYTAIPKASREGITCYPESVRQAIDAFPGQITLDRIVEIRNKHFEGHVFDFETVTGLINANGIIAHNCRCGLVDLTAEQARVRGYPLARPPVIPDPGFDRPESPLTPEENARRLLEEQASAVAGLVAAVAEFLQRVPPRLSERVRAELPLGLYEQLEAFVRSRGLEADGAAMVDIVAWQAQLRNGWAATNAALSGGESALTALQQSGAVIVATLRAILATSGPDAARKYLELLRSGKRLPDGRTVVEWLREHYPQFGAIEIP